MVWGAEIAWYLFLAGASAGAFITSAFIQFRYPDNTKIRVTGRIIAPVFICIGLVLLMVDARAGLHHPLRFMGLFANPRSVMTLGVYLLTVYAPLTIVVAVLELMKRKVPSWLVWVGSILAVGVAMYTGFLLGVLDTYPLWNSAVLPVLFLASALSSGSAACGLIAMFTDREAFEGMTSLKRYHVAIVVVEAVLLFTLVTIAASVSPEGAASVGMLVSGRYALPFWLGIIVLGLVLPLVSQGMSLSKPDSVSALGIMGEAGALIGGFLLRLLIILAALPVLFVM